MNLFTDPAFAPVVYGRDDAITPPGGGSWAAVAVMLGILALFIVGLELWARRSHG